MRLLLLMRPGTRPSRHPARPPPRPRPVSFSGRSAKSEALWASRLQRLGSTATERTEADPAARVADAVAAAAGADERYALTTETGGDTPGPPPLPSPPPLRGSPRPAPLCAAARSFPPPGGGGSPRPAAPTTPQAHPPVWHGVGAVPDHPPPSQDTCPSILPAQQTTSPLAPHHPTMDLLYTLKKFSMWGSL